MANIGVSTESRLAMLTAIYLSQEIEYMPTAAQAIEFKKKSKARNFECLISYTHQ